MKSRSDILREFWRLLHHRTLELGLFWQKMTYCFHTVCLDFYFYFLSIQVNLPYTFARSHIHTYIHIYIFICHLLQEQVKCYCASGKGNKTDCSQITYLSLYPYFLPQEERERELLCFLLSLGLYVKYCFFLI